MIMSDFFSYFLLGLIIVCGIILVLMLFIINISVNQNIQFCQDNGYDGKFSQDDVKYCIKYNEDNTFCKREYVVLSLVFSVPVVMKFESNKEFCED